MEEYQKRLLVEINELEERTSKLEQFIFNNEKYNELSDYDQEAMQDQRYAMMLYLSALSKRVRKFAMPYMYDADGTWLDKGPENDSDIVFVEWKPIPLNTDQEDGEEE